MDLFKSKESFKEKVDSDNNWKNEWFLSDIYFLKLSSGFVRKCLSISREVNPSVKSEEIHIKWNFLLYLTKNKKQISSNFIIQLHIIQLHIMQLHNHHFQNSWKIITN